MFNKFFNYTWIKDNISMLILFPTICGGLWQIIELSSIGTQYIRFFSISQLVSDGLLILYISVWVTLMAYISMYDKTIATYIIRDRPTITSITEEPAEENTHYITKTHGYLIIILVAGFLGAVVYFLFAPLIANVYQKQLMKVSDLMSATTYSLLVIVLVKGLFRTFIQIHGWEAILLRHNVQNAIRVIAAICYLGSLFVLYVFFSLFHKSFLLPENLKNKTYIQCRVNANNPDLKSWYIEYFNDKYIFINLTNKSKVEKIEILKFEDFLDAGVCDPTKNP